MDSSSLGDALGRRFSYLRLSVTDVCNFKCSYCLPQGYRKSAAAEEPLNQAEILRLVRAFAALGVWKIRLTGGEPTLRPDLPEIIRSIRALQGVRTIALTTNGYRLPERAALFREAGVDAINISIDSLRPEKFRDITGHDRLEEVTTGVLSCLAAGFQSVKINTVLLRGLNDGELDGFLAFVRGRPVSLRFIELMRTQDNADFFARRHLSASVIIKSLEEKGWTQVLREEGAGPAKEFLHPDSLGRIGIIAPYAKDFCRTCNRLRVSSCGDLHLCLFGEGGISLRPPLQRDEDIQNLKNRIVELLTFKKERHFLAEGNSGATRHLAAIGG